MTKREISVRILNILMVISFLVIYIKDKFWVDAGFYICTLYILYLVLKPFMLRQPLNTPFNYMFEFFDVLFVVAISALVTQNAFLPLAFFAILRCALMFPVYFVLLSYVVASISVAFFITSAVDISSVHELALTLLMMIIPPVVVCFVKNDVVKIDSVNRDLSEQLKIKAAVIDELQKYNDVQFSGDHKSESKILRTDFVTQIPNRFAFEEMLKKGVTKSHEPSFNMGLMMIYIDGLYQYRVKYSYSTEHILVKRIYDIVREQMKTNDFIARY